jgi:hypothetical protein
MRGTEAVIFPSLLVSLFERLILQVLPGQGNRRSCPVRELRTQTGFVDFGGMMKLV